MIMMRMMTMMMIVSRNIVPNNDDIFTVIAA